MDACWKYRRDDRGDILDVSPDIGQDAPSMPLDFLDDDPRFEYYPPVSIMNDARGELGAIVDRAHAMTLVVI